MPRPSTATPARPDNLNRAARLMRRPRTGELHADGEFALGWRSRVQEEQDDGQGTIRAIRNAQRDTRIRRAKRRPGAQRLRRLHPGGQPRRWGSCKAKPQAARSGANEIAHKSMAYAEQNMAATFEFAAEAHARQGSCRGHAPAIRVPRADKCRRCRPRLRSSAKCCQNSHGFCQAEALMRRL